MAAHTGLLTPEEAARDVVRLAVPCGDLLTGRIPSALYGELAEALGAVLKARSTIASDLRSHDQESLGDEVIALQGEGADERPAV